MAKTKAKTYNAAENRALRKAANVAVKELHPDFPFKYATWSQMYDWMQRNVKDFVAAE